MINVIMYLSITIIINYSSDSQPQIDFKKGWILREHFSRYDRIAFPPKRHIFYFQANANKCGPYWLSMTIIKVTPHPSLLN